MMYLVEEIPLHSPCRQKMDNLPKGKPNLQRVFRKTLSARNKTNSMIAVVWILWIVRWK